MMYLFLTSLVYSAVILGYGNIMNNSENSFLLDFAILFLLISLVSWFMQKSEKILKEKRKKALS